MDGVFGHCAIANYLGATAYHYHYCHYFGPLALTERNIFNIPSVHYDPSNALLGKRDPGAFSFFYNISCPLRSFLGKTFFWGGGGGGGRTKYLTSTLVTAIIFSHFHVF